MHTINLHHDSATRVSAQHCGTYHYCGRPSPLGNPYRIGVDGDRATVIRKYRTWLWGRLRSGDQAIIDALSGLTDDAVLGCWCTPLPCHCDVIIRAAHWLRSELSKRMDSWK